MTGFQSRVDKHSIEVVSKSMGNIIELFLSEVKKEILLIFRVNFFLARKGRGR